MTHVSVHKLVRWLVYLGWHGICAACWVGLPQTALVHVESHKYRGLLRSCDGPLVTLQEKNYLSHLPVVESTFSGS